MRAPSDQLQTNMRAKGFITPGEAAKRTGLSLTTVYRLLRSETVASERTPNGWWFIQVRSLANHLGEATAKACGLV